MASTDLWRRCLHRGTVYLSFNSFFRLTVIYQCLCAASVGALHPGVWCLCGGSVLVICSPVAVVRVPGHFSHRLQGCCILGWHCQGAGHSHHWVATRWCECLCWFFSKCVKCKKSERNMCNGSAGRSTWKHKERAMISQTHIWTISQGTYGEWGDVMEWMWAFLSM